MSDNEEGWVKDSDTGAWYYYCDGDVTTGWKDIDGEKYYFNHPGGSMGWSKEVDGKYLGPDGKMVTSEGWVNTDPNNYGTWYYVGANERVVTGWNKIGDDLHYFNYPGGSMTWDNTIDGFYIDNDGKIVSGTGWLKDGYSENWYYYSDGEMKTGWLQDSDNKWYYLNDDGSMATGWNKVNGDWYYFHSDGEMATGWVNDGNDWYYLYSNGSMTWDNTVGGYHLNSKGKMITGSGWVPSDGSWYYLKDDGSVATNWLQDEGNWYYLYPQGSMAHGTTVEGWNLDDSGKWITDKIDDSSNIGAKYDIVDGVKYPDYTEAINDMLKRNEPECFGHRKDIDRGLRWFISQVNYKKPWDLKYEPSWNKQLPNAPYLGADKNGNYGKFVFNGKITTAEELGNFTYGYWGTALDLREYILDWGAGAAQIQHDSKAKISLPKAAIDGLIKGGPSYGDNSEDTTQINEGVDYYLKTHVSKLEDYQDVFEDPYS